jgi:small nuclear ribonucleoprotein (snRNP)-like protein
MPGAQPELKKVRNTSSCVESRLTTEQYLDKRVEVQLNGSRKVMGTLRGYDVSCTSLNLSTT